MDKFLFYNYYRLSQILIMLVGLLSSIIVSCNVFADHQSANHKHEKYMSSEHSDIPSAEQIAKALGLEGHVEGGFFRRTYQADHRELLNVDGGKRYLMTSIFYMLTKQSPVGHWHVNKSDIIHYYHLGDPVEYSLIYPDGRLETVRMGSDVFSGEKLQLTVKGGVWKSSQLIDQGVGYGLISEAVSPGFDYKDMTLGEAKKLTNLFPQHKDVINAFSKKTE